MKSNTKLFKIFLFFILLITMLLGVSTAGNKSLAIFSFINSNVRLKGPSENNFKGNVSLDLEGKGIVLTANDGGQNEGLLKLVSEKIDS